MFAPPEPRRGRERQAKREKRLLDVIERNAAAAERLAVTIDNLGKMLERER